MTADGSMLATFARLVSAEIAVLVPDDLAPVNHDEYLASRPKVSTICALIGP